MQLTFSINIIITRATCSWASARVRMVQHGTYLARTIRVLVLTVPITRSSYVWLWSDRTARGQYYVIGRFLIFYTSSRFPTARNFAPSIGIIYDTVAYLQPPDFDRTVQKICPAPIICLLLHVPDSLNAPLRCCCAPSSLRLDYYYYDY